MPKFSNMPDMGDVDIPDNKPVLGKNKKPNDSEDDDLNNQLTNAIGNMISNMFGGGPNNTFNGNESPDELVDSVFPGATEQNVSDILQEFIDNNNGDISEVPMETLLQHVQIELEKNGFTMASTEDSSLDNLADVINQILSENEIAYADGGDSDATAAITEILKDNGRIVQPNNSISLTDAEFYIDKVTSMLASAKGKDPNDDDFFSEIYDSICSYDGTTKTIPNNPGMSASSNEIISALLSVYDTFSKAAASLTNQSNNLAQQPLDFDDNDDEEDDDSDDSSNHDDMVAVVKLADTNNKLSDTDIEDVLAKYNQDDLNALADEYSKLDNWSKDGQAKFDALKAYVDSYQTTSQPQTQQVPATTAQQQPTPAAKPASKKKTKLAKAPDILPLNDMSRATNLAAFLCQQSDDLEGEFVSSALSGVSQLSDKSYPIEAMANLECVNENEVDWKGILLKYNRFFIERSTEKFVICRTLADDIDVVGFDFSVFKDPTGKMKVYVPLMFNTIRQDGKPIVISDYVPEAILNAESEEQDNANFLSVLGKLSGSQQPQTQQPDTRTANIAAFHKDLMRSYDIRKIEDYCNLAIKEKTFVSLCANDFGTLEKKDENKQYMKGFVYVGNITPNLENQDSKYFISDHELDPNAKSYEFYVKLSSNELTPDDMKGFKKIVNSWDYSSDTMKNIDLESDGEIVFISIPLAYYLTK
jgi:hypothetical protein